MTEFRPIFPGLAVGASGGSPRYATLDETDFPDVGWGVACATAPARQRRCYTAKTGLVLLAFAGVSATCAAGTDFA